MKRRVERSAFWATLAFTASAFAQEAADEPVPDTDTQGELEPAEPELEPAEKPEPEPEPEPAAPPKEPEREPEEPKRKAAPAPAPGEPELDQDEGLEAEVEGTTRREATLGLAPGAPQVATLPGGVTPAYGAESVTQQDWRFNFHGFLTLPLRIGIDERENAAVGQKTTTLHTPPRVPGDFETFEYTTVVPEPWAQLNFSYGNPTVTATVVVAARTVANAEHFFNPPDHIGINDAFLSFTFPSEKSAFDLHVGGFAVPYGNMGEYDLGRYGTPVIARVGGMGVLGTGRFDLGSVDIVTEAGFHGQLTKAPVGAEPAGWNGFADPNVGSSFVAHGHGAIGFSGLAQVGLHYLYTFVQDDRATPGATPDGNIGVLGADARLTMGRFGHLYVGGALTDAETAAGISPVIRILNTGGGPELVEEYFGPDSGGTGKLTTLGAQYDLSLGTLLRYPAKFEGDGPDIVLSGFGMFTSVDSDDPAFDGISKVKYGAEVGYSMLSWFGPALRYDRVIPDTDDNSQTHAVITGRLIFRSDFNAQDQVVLQYSRFINGSGTTVKEGYPPVRDPTIEPDENMVSLSASMWW
jgi:hypothetical protein